MKLVFVDVDGSRYYLDRAGDIVNREGRLVSITEEDNIRPILRMAWARKCWQCGAPLAEDEQTLCKNGTHRNHYPGRSLDDRQTAGMEVV